LPRRFDLIEHMPRCEIRHRGVLLDLGSPSVEGLDGWKLAPDPALSSVEREGATWVRVGAKSLSYRFSLDEPQSIFVGARLRGAQARSASVYLDGKPIPMLSFARGQTRTISNPLLSTPVAAGPHLLGLRFAGSSREGAEPFAEIDWLRIGFPDDDSTAFAAPTLGDVIQPRLAFQGVPHRSLALRAPGVARCTVGIPTGARFRASIGLLGAGEGEAEIRILRDGQPGEVLKNVKVSGGEHPLWTDLELPLDAYAGQLVTVEMAASLAYRGARIVFGDPMIEGKEQPLYPMNTARAVIVVVLSSVDPARLPPWAPDRPLPTFDSLAREGAVFERYRSPSTIPAASLASMLTGLTPRQHSVEDAYARLPSTLPTLATIARDASIRTAMFSSNPATSEAFGFERGWERFLSHSPVSPALGTAPIEDLISWVGEHAKRSEKGLLAFVHTRGIHPPYDVSPGDFAQMLPHPNQEYAGPLDPRRTGQILEKMRNKKRNIQQKWTEHDTMRLTGMIDSSLAQTDRSLSNLVDALRKAGLWNDTLLLVTSDVAGATDPAVLPFAETMELTEDALRVPLYVHFPGGAHAGERIAAPATAMDIARTALSALGIEAAAAPGGVDLFELAERGLLPAERPLVATLPDRFAARLGDFRMVGRDNHPPFLCDLRVDPRCEKDLHEQLPLVTETLWRFAYDQESLARPPQFTRPRREPATLDPDTAAALGVWGR
jgi:arylsulfatase A-like enzyme